MTDPLNHCFSEVNLNGLPLRNRLIKAATTEGLTPSGQPTMALASFHRRFGEGGFAMTTLGFSAAEADGRIDENMMYMEEPLRAPLTDVVRAIKSSGVAVSGQLGHGGGFTRNAEFRGRRPYGPSRAVNYIGLLAGRLPFSGAMNQAQIRERVEAFGRAAAFMKSVGFDAIEVHFGHGYGLSQFISPITNRRSDEYGGSLVNRMRLPLEVLASVRDAVGPRFPVLGKISMSDGVAGGVHFEESVEIAAMLEKGGIDCIVCSAGTSSMNVAMMFRGESPLSAVVKYERNRVARTALRLVGKRVFDRFRDYPYHDLYLLDPARRIRDRVQCGVCYLGGACSAEDIRTVMSAGFDFIQMGRAAIYDPALPHHVQDEPEYKNGCTHCNQCVGLIQADGGTRCVLR